MASGPDLFVVCKGCGSEVSPYITECPYCGTRLRKRAPKIERGGFPPPAPEPVPEEPPSLGKLRRGEMPGVQVEGRPVVTVALVVASVLVTLVARTGLLDLEQFAVFGPIAGEWWRTATTLFAYTQAGYEVLALAAVALFGWLLERRHGHLAPLLVFLAAGAGGMAVVGAVEAAPLALGANGAALGLLAAWAMRDVLARRGGVEDESDLLGAAVFAAVLLLLPVASAEAHALAGLVGGAIGVLLGLFLARLG